MDVRHAALLAADPADIHATFFPGVVLEENVDGEYIAAAGSYLDLAHVFLPLQRRLTLRQPLYLGGAHEVEALQRLCAKVANEVLPDAADRVAEGAIQLQDVVRPPAAAAATDDPVFTTLAFQPGDTFELARVCPTVRSQAVVLQPLDLAQRIAIGASVDIEDLIAEGVLRLEEHSLLDALLAPILDGEPPPVVRQRPDSNVCGPAVVATVARVDLEAGIHAVGKRGKTCAADLRRGLARYRLHLGPPRPHARIGRPAPALPTAGVFLARVRWSPIQPRRGHWVLLWHGRILDPLSGIDPTYWGEGSQITSLWPILPSPPA